MIPKKFRLPLDSDTPFRGRKIFHQWFIVIVGAAGTPQWAVRVSKKIDNRAVHRNRLRRQISQWLYRHRNELTPQQFLIILRHKPTEADLPHLFNDLQSTLFLS